jgi:thiol-disulfide isomerase/thioredoxin
MQAAQRQAEQRRRLVLVGGSVLLVIVVVVAFIVIKGLNHPKQGGGTSGGLPTSVVDDITHVPASALSQVGTGALPDSSELPLKAISDTTLATVNGKPEMLYIGAEFCPYCAAMRWSMAVALSRFGTFTSPLQYIHSSSTDTDPNTPTLTFYKTTYSSQYLVFTPVENETISHALLQTPTAAEQTLWNKYNPNAYPFIDFGNKYVIKDPSYDPGVLAGLTWAQVATALHDPSSKVAQDADGAANLITAAICKMTNGQPGSVCTQSGVVKASGSL